jgi:hypothetical protein
MGERELPDPDAYLFRSDDPTVRLVSQNGQCLEKKAKKRVIEPRPVLTAPSPNYDPDEHLYER